jgi:hypothetical protein
MNKYMKKFSKTNFKKLFAILGLSLFILGSSFNLDVKQAEALRSPGTARCNLNIQVNGTSVTFTWSGHLDFTDDTVESHAEVYVYGYGTVGTSDSYDISTAGQTTINNFPAGNNWNAELSIGYMGGCTTSRIFTVIGLTPCSIGSFTADSYAPTSGTATTLRFTLNGTPPVNWSINGASPSSGSGSGTASTGTLTYPNSYTYNLNCGQSSQSLTVTPPPPGGGGGSPGRFKCLATNQCGWDPNDSGPNQCGSNSDCATVVDNPSCGYQSPMAADSAIRGCSGYSERIISGEGSAQACLNDCVAGGYQSCEWYEGNGDCYGENSSGGCYVEYGYSGWYAATIPATLCHDPVNGGWGAWSGYGACSVSGACGQTGNQSQSRTCNNPSPAYGGLECLKTNGTRGLSETMTQSCSTAICPGMSGTLTANPNPCTIPAGNSTCQTTLTWATQYPEATSAITASGMASVSGNNGSQAFTVPYGGRTFYLYNNSKSLVPSSPNGSGLLVNAVCASGTTWDGSTCAAPLVVNGVCGPTHYLCNAGTSAYGAEDSTHYAWACLGSGGGTDAPYCPEQKINGGWTAWSSWSACSVSGCGQTGTQTSTRTCTAPAPSHGGADCSGSPVQTQSCTMPACVNISATPTTITTGQSTTLTWSSTASSCTGTNFSTGGAASGTLLVSPTATITYGITCSGVSNSATVTVKKKPVIIEQ